MKKIILISVVVVIVIGIILGGLGIGGVFSSKDDLIKKESESTISSEEQLVVDAGQKNNIIKLNYTVGLLLDYTYTEVIKEDQTNVDKGLEKKEITYTNTTHKFQVLCNNVTDNIFEMYLIFQGSNIVIGTLNENTKKIDITSNQELMGFQTYLGKLQDAQRLIEEGNYVPQQEESDEERIKRLEAEKKKEEQEQLQKQQQSQRDRLFNEYDEQAEEKRMKQLEQEKFEKRQKVPEIAKNAGPLSENELYFLAKRGISKELYLQSNKPLVKYTINKQGKILDYQVPINLPGPLQSIYRYLVFQLSPILKQEVYTIQNIDTKRVLREKIVQYKYRDLNGVTIEPKMNAQIDENKQNSGQLSQQEETQPQNSPSDNTEIKEKNSQNCVFEIGYLKRCDATALFTKIEQKPNNPEMSNYIKQVIKTTTASINQEKIQAKANKQFMKDVVDYFEAMSIITIKFKEQHRHLRELQEAVMKQNVERAKIAFEQALKGAQYFDNLTPEKRKEAERIYDKYFKGTQFEKALLEERAKKKQRQLLEFHGTKEEEEDPYGKDLGQPKDVTIIKEELSGLTFAIYFRTRCKESKEIVTEDACVVSLNVQAAANHIKVLSQKVNVNISLLLKIYNFVKQTVKQKISVIKNDVLGGVTFLIQALKQTLDHALSVIDPKKSEPLKLLCEVIDSDQLGISDIITSLENAITDTIDGANKFLDDPLGIIKEKLTSFLADKNQGITESLSDIKNFIQNKYENLQQIIDKVKNAGIPSSLKEAALDYIDNSGDILKSAIDEPLNYLLDSIEAYLLSKTNELYQLQSQIVSAVDTVSQKNIEDQLYKVQQDVILENMRQAQQSLRDESEKILKQKQELENKVIEKKGKGDSAQNILAEIKKAKDSQEAQLKKATKEELDKIEKQIDTKAIIENTVKITKAPAQLKNILSSNFIIDQLKTLLQNLLGKARKLIIQKKDEAIDYILKQTEGPKNKLREIINGIRVNELNRDKYPQEVTDFELILIELSDFTTLTQNFFSGYGELKNHVGKLFDELKKLFGPGGKGLESFKSLSDSIIAYPNQLLSDLKEKGLGIAVKVKDIGGKINQKIDIWKTSLMGNVEQMGRNFRGLIKTMQGFFKKPDFPADDPSYRDTPSINDVYEVVHDIQDLAKSFDFSSLTDLLNTFKEVPQKFIDFVTFFKVQIDKLSKYWTMIKASFNKVKSTGDKFWNNLKGRIDDVTKQFTDIIKGEVAVTFESSKSLYEEDGNFKPQYRILENKSVFEKVIGKIPLNARSINDQLKKMQVSGKIFSVLDNVNSVSGEGGQLGKAMQLINQITGNLKGDNASVGDIAKNFISDLLKQFTYNKRLIIPVFDFPWDYSYEYVCKGGIVFVVKFHIAFVIEFDIIVNFEQGALNLSLGLVARVEFSVSGGVRVPLFEVGIACDGFILQGTIRFVLQLKPLQGFSGRADIFLDFMPYYLVFGAYRAGIGAKNPGEVEVCRRIITEDQQQDLSRILKPADPKPIDLRAGISEIETADQKPPPPKKLSNAGQGCVPNEDKVKHLRTWLFPPIVIKSKVYTLKICCDSGW